MFPNMRTPAVVVALLMGTGACTDTASPHGANLMALSGAEFGACGRGETQLRCWGSLGALTGGTTASSPMLPGSPINSLELVRRGPFDDVGCGLDASGTLFCWGPGGTGYAPVAPGLRFTDVTMGQAFQCALSTSSTVYCWGVVQGTGIALQDAEISQCGSGLSAYACVMNPTAITSSEHFKAVASGWYHTCAVAQSGQVFCWGSGAGLGAGADVQEAQTPVPVESQDRFSAISSGTESSCAISAAGQPVCWGYNTGGMLGGSETKLDVPTPVELPSGVVMKAISLGASHSCSLDTTGAAWCWGTGGLGNGTSVSHAPVQVLGGLTFTSVAAGGGFTCGVAGNGAWCWGANSYGQLGNGGSADSPIPVRVANQDQFED